MFSKKQKSVVLVGALAALVSCQSDEYHKLYPYTITTSHRQYICREVTQDGDSLILKNCLDGYNRETIGTVIIRVGIGRDVDIVHYK